MQFPLKQGQTYFNNATLGPMPDYTISRMIDNLRENSIHAAETDYSGAGPQLLTGYFKEESLREKVGNLINADFDEIALSARISRSGTAERSDSDLESAVKVIRLGESGWVDLVIENR